MPSCSVRYCNYNCFWSSAITADFDWMNVLVNRRSSKLEFFVFNNCTVPCTADLVGLWPVSDEVSPRTITKSLAVDVNDVTDLCTYFGVSLSLTKVKRWEHGAVTEVAYVTVDVLTLVRVRTITVRCVWTKLSTRCQPVNARCLGKRCLSNGHAYTVKQAINQSVTTATYQ